MLNSERFQKLYEEVEFFLNNSPIEADCSDEENDVYCELANLKNSIDNYRNSNNVNPIHNGVIHLKSTDTYIVDHSFGYDEDIWKGSGVEVR